MSDLIRNSCPTVRRLALREWREAQGMSTLDVAKFIYPQAGKEIESADLKGKAEARKIRQKYQRRISYLETGRTEISNDLLKAFLKEKTFKEKLLDEYQQNEREMLAGGVARNDFPDQQTAFLEKNEYKYDMLFINAVGVPFFRDKNALLETWIKNLKNGINYHLIWDFSDLNFDTECKKYWAIQLEYIDVIAQALDDCEGDIGAIEIFAFRRSSLETEDGKQKVDSWCSQLEKLRSSMLDSHESSSQKLRVMFHSVFDLDEDEEQCVKPKIPARVSWFLTKFSYSGGATLAYIHNGNQIMKYPAYVHLECNDTLGAFSREETTGWHIFFGKPHTTIFEENLEAFMVWAASRYGEVSWNQVREEDKS